MKELLTKLKTKIINFLKWIMNEVKDWHNLIILIIVAAAVFTVSVLGVILALFIADQKIHIAYSVTLVFLFWAGPFTPFWPLCIAITLFIRRFIEKIWLPKHNQKKMNEENNEKKEGQ